jgi:hypothetical protein
MPPQTIRDTVLARAAELGWTAYAVEQAIANIGSPVSERTVRRYFAGTHDLTTEKLDPILRVLGLQVMTIPSKKEPAK